MNKHDYTKRFLNCAVGGKAQARQLLVAIVKQLQSLHRSNSRNRLEENSEDARYALSKIEEALAAVGAGDVVIEMLSDATIDYGSSVSFGTSMSMEKIPADSMPRSKVRYIPSAILSQ